MFASASTLLTQINFLKYEIIFPLFSPVFAHCALKCISWLCCLKFKTKWVQVFSGQQQYKASDIPRDRSIVVVTCFIRRVFYYRSIELKLSSSLHDQFELPKHDSDSCLLDLGCCCWCWHEPKILQRVEWQSLFSSLCFVKFYCSYL